MPKQKVTRQKDGGWIGGCLGGGGGDVIVLLACRVQMVGKMHQGSNLVGAVAAAASS